MDYSRPDRADRIAAAYVTGTLRGPARNRLEKLLPAHPALQDAVDLWEARLVPLTLSIPPREPPAAVWPRIERQLFGNTAAQAASPSGWWQRVAFWRGASGLGLAMALGLAVLLAQPRPAQVPLVVVLNAVPATAAGPAPASFVASISADGRAMVTTPLSQVSLQPDKVLELWSVPAAGAPRSLGLISAQGATVVHRERLLDGTAALAVSLEPPGGSPTGSPTGAILFMGKLSL